MGIFIPMVYPGTKSSTPTELFRTSKGVVYQDDRQCCFTLKFMHRTAHFKVQEFLHFKRSIDKINLEDLFFNDLSDLHIIHHRHSDHLFLVTLCDLVALKELLSGTKVMLELNSILSARLAPCGL